MQFKMFYGPANYVEKELREFLNEYPNYEIENTSQSHSMDEEGVIWLVIILWWRL